MPCLGFLEGSNCPHYDGEVDRRPAFQKMISKGKVSAGVAADDGVGLHFIDQKLARVVSTSASGRGWRVDLTDDGIREQALVPQRLVL
jgi:peptidase E